MYVSQHTFKSQIAPSGMLHPLYGMNSSLISVSLVRQSPALSPITHGSSSSLLSPLASSLTRSVFHSELKTWLFSKSFPPYTFSFTTGLTTRTLGPSNVFTLLNGCTGKCVRLSQLLAFECTLNHCTFINSVIHS